MKKAFLFPPIIFIFIFNVFCSKAQNKYTVKIIQPDPVEAPVLSTVTVSTGNKNVVSWEQTLNEQIRYFNIYRDAVNQENVWVLVGKTSYPGTNSFTDPTSYPGSRPYKYRVSAVDACGNEVFNNRVHKTIKLTVEEVADRVKLLKWNPYEGFETERYKIYRSSTFTNLILIDSIDVMRTSYIDSENPYTSPYYQVEAIEKIVTPAARKSGTIKGIVRSNISSGRSLFTSADTADASRLSIYPNPMTFNAIVVFPYEATHPCTLTILDLTGKVVYSKSVTSGETEIERNNLKDGLYILQVAGKRIYRKKLMVGKT
jgi:hypothetical protein